MTSKIEIVSRASSATGNGPITSLADNSDVALIVDSHYDAILEAMLTQHAWKFARRTAALTLLADEVETPWDALWQAPTGMLALQYLVDPATGLRIEHEERDLTSGRAFAVLGDFDAITAVFTYHVSEDRFPADFALALQYRLEAVMLSGIAEQRDQANRREQAAFITEQKARVRDQRSSTATDAGEWDLTVARRAGSRWMYARA